jgi:hypothetical protein
MRGSRALVMSPNLALMKLPNGLLKLVWLKTLKNPARKTSHTPSLMVGRLAQAEVGG